MDRGCRIHGVLVTFRRPDDLADSLARIGGQSRPLDTLVVVDNDADPTTELAVQRHHHIASKLQYLPSKENLGPAGALALGTELVLEEADEGDWVIFLDDDDPPRTDRTFADVLDFAIRMSDEDATLGGVGLVGGLIDFRKGQGMRVKDADLHGPMRVTYIGGGQFPCYRVGALRAVGTPLPGLFFGFDDLEFGIRFMTAGYSLFVDGDRWREERRARNRLGLEIRPQRVLSAPCWRDYYATRNLIYVLRRQSELGAARVLLRRVVARPVGNLVVHPRAAVAHLVIGIRAAFDAYTGRLGRRIEPTLAGTTGRRHTKWRPTGRWTRENRSS